MGLASRIGIFFIGVAVLFSLSCEKHHLGEYPEVQSEQMTTAGNVNPGSSAGGSAAPTPVNFFPEKKIP